MKEKILAFIKKEVVLVVATVLAIVSAFVSFGGGYGDESAIYWGQAGNNNLGWEKSANFNIGVDWAFLDRVNMTVEYYNKTTTDLLFSVPTSIVTGFSSNWQNLGKMQNQGVELSLTSTNISTKDFTCLCGSSR